MVSLTCKQDISSCLVHNWFVNRIPNQSIECVYNHVRALAMLFAYSLSDISKTPRLNDNIDIDLKEFHIFKNLYEKKIKIHFLFYVVKKRKNREQFCDHYLQWSLLCALLISSKRLTRIKISLNFGNAKLNWNQITPQKTL